MRYPFYLPSHLFYLLPHLNVSLVLLCIFFSPLHQPRANSHLLTFKHKTATEVKMTVPGAVHPLTVTTTLYYK